ncbi:MAG TPA: hypothetical protein DCX54_07325 [Flavobacteriales bacterium]|nr:hypothetical protein [Flavobacteriales bacterium]
MTNPVRLLISLSIEGGDQTELNNLTHELKSEIKRLKIDSIDDTSKGIAPKGTKAADWTDIGNMVITLAPAVIPPLFELLVSWIDRKPSTPVKIKIKVGRKTAQIEYDPTKTSSKELETIVKTLGRAVKK